MPSFNFLKSSAKESTSLERVDSAVESDEVKEQQAIVEKRASKREFLKGLMKRSSANSEAKGSRWRSSQSSV